MKPPPCIQTMTGFFTAGVEVLGPDVQILAVLVRDPVAMRKHELVGADRGLLRTRTDRAPDLGVLDARPRLDRLRRSKPFRFRVADAEKREVLPSLRPRSFPHVVSTTGGFRLGPAADVAAGAGGAASASLVRRHLR